MKLTQKDNKSNKNKKHKKGQDEMVGFALIIVMVAVIFIVIISVYIKKPQEKTVDYQANSFIQAMLQYTTNCQEENLDNLTVQDLISKCKQGNPCYTQNMNPCVMLNNTIKSIIKTSWKVGTGSPIKGYEFNINVSTDGKTEETFMNIKEGVVTNNYKGAEQDLPPQTGSWEYAIITFNVYS